MRAYLLAFCLLLLVSAGLCDVVACDVAGIAVVHTPISSETRTNRYFSFNVTDECRSTITAASAVTVRVGRVAAVNATDSLHVASGWSFAPDGYPGGVPVSGSFSINTEDLAQSDSYYIMVLIDGAIFGQTVPIVVKPEGNDWELPFILALATVPVALFIFVCLPLCGFSACFVYIQFVSIKRVQARRRRRIEEDQRLMPALIQKEFTADGAPVFQGFPQPAAQV
ncbi:hypothetical protein J8273_3308 [Carpediemonas membranifera]|uniref:Uncharacterized protein n=1 Tax=Carpediemonas membranifera TaxID=201153 RepID=A0A8J6B527_9EUKA|nr:hypothetical protein J8273_3308 [Carpediemonas membranifera]|eukprot:KAG9393179.1 hypothetical protein J8273_3308 [Carpediemonas membranifera]